MVNDITKMCDFCDFRFSLTRHGERFQVKQTLKSKYKTFLFGIENSKTQSKNYEKQEYVVFSSNEKTLSQRSLRTARIQLEYSELFGYVTTDWLLCWNGGLRTLIRRYG